MQLVLKACINYNSYKHHCSRKNKRFQFSYIHSTRKACFTYSPSCWLQRFSSVYRDTCVEGQLAASEYAKRSYSEKTTQTRSLVICTIRDTISGESSEFLWEENLCSQGIEMSSHLLNYVNWVTVDVKLHMVRTQQRNSIKRWCSVCSQFLDTKKKTNVAQLG